MANHQVAEQETLGQAMSKTELFLEKNGRKMSYIFLALLIVAALIYGYQSLIVSPRQVKAAEMIAEAQIRFESENPDYELALMGDDNGAGFIDVVEKYGSTPAGNLAKHYVGICYLHMGQFEQAASYLSKFSSVKGIPGAVINAQNLGLQGDVAVEMKDYKKAVKFYLSAVEESDNNFTAPLYLEKAAVVEKAQGNVKEAEKLLNRILEQYPASMQARNAEKLLGGLN